MLEWRLAPWAQLAPAACSAKYQRNQCLKKRQVQHPALLLTQNWGQDAADWLAVSRETEG